MPAAASSLLDPQTALRHLGADEAPYPGWLHAGTPPTMWVELDQLPEDVWRCAPDGHLLVPVDVARTLDGLAAVVPHCPTRLSIGLAERATPGGTVTIAVSMVRAAAEARDHGFTEGSWWLDASGRPVLAVHDGAAWVDDGRDLLEHLAERAGALLGEALVRAAILLGETRWRNGDVESCEDQLFAAAEPEPLDGMDAAPRGDGRFPLPLRATTVRAARVETEPAAAESWLARFTDADWAGRVAEAVRGVVAIPGRLRERVRGRREEPSSRRSRAEKGKAERAERTHSSPSVRRRAPLLVAVAVGAVVIGGGLLWPEPERPAVADSQSRRPVGSAGVDATMPPVTAASGDEASGDEVRTRAATPAAPEPTDLEGVALDIVRALGRCGALAGECAALLERPEMAAPTGVVVSGAADTVTTLLDEYGGVAVFRVESAALAPQILVLVSVNGKWLVRDVYDVADQP